MKTSPVTCDCHAVHEDAVQNAVRQLPSGEDLSALAGWFKVLGDATRVKILCALEHTELCVCDLAVTLNMTKSAVSHQLGTLRQAGVVTFRREGKNVYYRLDDQHVRDMLEVSLTHIRHKQG